MRPGAVEAFAAAVAADPRYGYAHAGLAVLEFFAGPGHGNEPGPGHRNEPGPGHGMGSGRGHGMGSGPAGPAEHLAEAEASAGTASAAERATIELVGRCLRLPAAQRLPVVATHLATYPTDTLAVIVGVASVDRGADGPEPVINLLEPILPAHQGHWFVPGLLATWLAEAGELWSAWWLAGEALTVEPAAWHAVHARAHVAYGTDEHGPGADQVEGWMRVHHPDGYGRSHLAWHAALGRLASGEPGAAVSAMLHAWTPRSPAPGLDLVELATAGWLCRFAGDRSLADRLRADPARLVGLVPAAAGASPLSVVATGLLLAGAGRLDDLAALTATATGRAGVATGRAGVATGGAGTVAGGTPAVTREVVLPVLDACAGMAAADPAAVRRAVDLLSPVALRRLGGSNAERDALERCLLFASRADPDLFW